MLFQKPFAHVAESFRVGINCGVECVENRNRVELVDVVSHLRMFLSFFM